MSVTQNLHVDMENFLNFQGLALLSIETKISNRVSLVSIGTKHSKHIVVAIQARMSSHRLPGKVLEDVNGVSVLGHCIARCKSAAVGEVVVATSENTEDDPVAMFGARVGAKVFRGPLHNVVERFRLLADAFEAKAVVRISGDSPFIDPALIKRAVEIGCDTDSDLVTNVLTRTFPKGQSVEILSREVLDRLASMTLSDFDKEHVTTRIYKEPSAYQILSFESSEEYGEVQLSVDTPADLELAIRLDRKMNGDVVGWRELVTAKEALDGE